MQENSKETDWEGMAKALESTLDRLKSQFGRVEVALRATQNLLDAENYSGASQVLPTLAQEVEDFSKELGVSFDPKPEKKSPEEPPLKKGPPTTEESAQPKSETKESAPL